MRGGPAGAGTRRGGEGSPRGGGGGWGSARCTARTPPVLFSFGGRFAVKVLGLRATWCGRPGSDRGSAFRRGLCPGCMCPGRLLRSSCPGRIKSPRSCVLCVASEAVLFHLHSADDEIRAARWLGVPFPSVVPTSVPLNTGVIC